jgi:arsenate reductase
MAHGYLNTLQHKLATVYSAGIETHGLNLAAVAIMAEDGIDISHHTSNNVNEYDGMEWDYIITVCDHVKENCPYIPSKKAKQIHHNFFDPSKVLGTAAEKHTAFLKARNEIKEFCAAFVKKELN